MRLFQSPVEIRDPQTGRLVKVILNEHRVFTNYAYEYDNREFGYYYAYVQQTLYDLACEELNPETVSPLVSYFDQFYTVYEFLILIYRRFIGCYF